MHTLTLPPKTILERWFGLIQTDRTELLLPSQYLVLGADVAGLIHLPTPTEESLTDLLRLIRDQAPEILGYALVLSAESAVGRHALLELAVDALVATEGWNHPSQVLERPRPEYRDLVPICRERVRTARRGERSRLEDVTTKVETAARIAEEARARRQKMQDRKATRRP